MGSKEGGISVPVLVYMYIGRIRREVLTWHTSILIIFKLLSSENRRYVTCQYKTSQAGFHAGGGGGGSHKVDWISTRYQYIDTCLFWNGNKA